jgi:hypothetical protein
VNVMHQRKAPRSVMEFQETSRTQPRVVTAGLDSTEGLRGI